MVWHNKKCQCLNSMSCAFEHLSQLDNNISFCSQVDLIPSELCWGMVSYSSWRAIFRSLRFWGTTLPTSSWWHSWDSEYSSYTDLVVLEGLGSVLDSCLKTAAFCRFSNLGNCLCGLSQEPGREEEKNQGRESECNVWWHSVIQITAWSLLKSSGSTLRTHCLVHYIKLCPDTFKQNSSMDK